MKIFNQWFWYRFTEEVKGVLWIIIILLAFAAITDWTGVDWRVIGHG